jgi:hypothetical protein
MISILLNIWRLVFWTNIWCILKNAQHTLRGTSVLLMLGGSDRGTVGSCQLAQDLYFLGDFG